jgi:hypothetical protein
MFDFSIKDAHGHLHRLYPDYLDQNKVVVIKFFFTTCPPCIANAPYWQQKYLQWGSGTQGVEFFSITTITSDYDPEVVAFENTYQQTMKGVSQDGGAQGVANPFKNGNYGPWWGTPSFIVIAPNRKLFYPVFFDELDAKINQAKALVAIPPSTVNISAETYNNDIPDGHVRFYVQPRGVPASKIEIEKNAQGKYTFSYPSTDFPEMNNPEVIMESFGPAYTSKVSASDLVLIQKHILGLESLSPAYKIIAADVNSDNKITASDILNIRKVILGLSSTFPNNTPSYKSIPEKLEFAKDPGNTVTLNFTVVKIGNVN